MKILKCTNTFTPHVGGVARSVGQFSRRLRETGHEVRIIAPHFPNTPGDEEDVIRIPAVQQFNGTDFSLPLPRLSSIETLLDGFEPDMVHSHHPFLLGDTALRISAAKDIPIIFTHHTQYEKYTHYIPGDSEVMKRFVIQLAVGYCNLCDAVIAPSETIRQRLIEQGVKTRIVEIPTGVDLNVFGCGEGKEVRKRTRIPDEAFVIGHAGRLAPEKGLDFLGSCVSRYVAETPDTWFLVAGSGPSEESIRNAFRERNLEDRLVMLGSLDHSALAEVYAAMDVFVFSSHSETQGMVLTEAMASRTPVIAIEAPGVREVLRDRQNGRMIDRDDEDEFVAALGWFHDLPKSGREQLRNGAYETAQQFSLPVCADRLIRLYEEVREVRSRPEPSSIWSDALRRLGEEWLIWSNRAEAARTAIFEAPGDVQSRTEIGSPT